MTPEEELTVKVAQHYRPVNTCGTCAHMGSVRIPGTITLLGRTCLLGQFHIDRPEGRVCDRHEYQGKE